MKFNSYIEYVTQVGNLVLLDVHPLSKAAEKFSAGLAAKRSDKVFQIVEQIGENSFRLKPIGDMNNTSLDANSQKNNHWVGIHHGDGILFCHAI
ncbi:Hypothetical predicted protein [Cloeon dipterum]|uniref:Uncharacterized protein n=1 Tax=Cloeon dipterum TaxID=197152 RepID=A0A8S1DXR5_9INSE|nr:Hypothetical predicted protein [Cloeon dipterum]